MFVFWGVLKIDKFLLKFPYVFIQKELKFGSHKKLYMNVIVALIIIAKSWKLAHVFFNE